jgi:hypothetical protein
MTTSAWGGSFGEAPNSAWGDSFGFEGFAAVVTPPVTIPPGGGRALYDHGHRGSLYWKRYQEELRNKKKKKTKKEELLEELDQHLVELNARIDEVPVEEIEPNWVAELRRTEAFAYNELVTEHTNKEILAYLTILREITQEMDDEDAIILALH